MKDFLNCYEKLDVDYRSIKNIDKIINRIDNLSEIKETYLKVSDILGRIRKRLDGLKEAADAVAIYLHRPYSIELDRAVELRTNEFVKYAEDFREICKIPYDVNREKKLYVLIDKLIVILNELVDLLKESYSVQKVNEIQLRINTIIEEIIPAFYDVVDEPFIDETHKILIKKAVDEAENIKFPIKSDVPLKKNAVLHNAYNIEETQELNSIYHINFMIPGDDNKVECIQPNGFIRYNEDGQLYRITKTGMSHDDTDIMTVEAEHVITTLSNDVMYGSHTFGTEGVTKTSAVINYILGFQKTKNWVLAGCDFDRRFQYTWKHETLLSALLSVPKEFGEDYMWDYDTTTYPWKLYLRRLDKTSLPKFYIRAKRNLISAEHSSDYSGIVTRVYALGYEDQDGVQLDISSANGGIPYVEADPEIIAKYGLISVVLIDRRFENAESLKAYAEAYLKNALEPGVSRTFDVVDLYPITNTDIDNAYVGALTRLVGDGTNVFITKTTRVHDQPGNLTLELSTKSTTLVDQIADIANRVQINSVYS